MTLFHQSSVHLIVCFVTDDVIIQLMMSSTDDNGVIQTTETGEANLFDIEECNGMQVSGIVVRMTSFRLNIRSIIMIACVMIIMTLSYGICLPTCIDWLDCHAGSAFGRCYINYKLFVKLHYQKVSLK